MLQTKKTDGNTEWFVQDRFGMFIHWGLYALPARHEWIKQYEEISDEDYDKYFKHFDPDLYNPELWAQTAANAGMKYFVITTKHHEGFCLWDSAYTDYKATKTPYGKDILTPMVKAFRQQNLRVGLYHSLIDWHHPHFIIDDMHSQRNHPERAKMNARRNQKKYIEYLHNQVRELLTQFGKVDILWFDFSYPPGKHGRDLNWIGKSKDDWDSETLYKMIRQLMPEVILDDRLDLDYGWDIKTPEQFMPREWVKDTDGMPVVWEACNTLSGSWGYHRDESSWKSVDQLLMMLIDTVSKGGNFLLNVGPTGRGELDYRALECLNGMGEWMKRHGRSIYGCTQAPAEFQAPQDCRLTYNPKTKRMYVHILNWPFQTLFMDGFAGKVEYAQLLNDASEVKFEGLAAWQVHAPGAEVNKNNTLTLRLPVRKPNVTVPVIELFMKD